MNDFVIVPPPVIAVPVAGGGLFPVRRVFCVGRNYAAHAREMGHDPSREPPFFFTKPADAVVTGGAAIPYPPACKSLHHEMELVVAIGQGGTAIGEDAALDHVYGYAPGVDLTRRDMQDEAKAMRRPWDMSKGFDASAPIGAVIPVSRIGHPARGRIALSVNGTARQDADLADMIWSVPEIIASLSRLVTLAPGDLIFTGTPEGVAAIEQGDRVEGEIAQLGKVSFQVT